MAGPPPPPPGGPPMTPEYMAEDQRATVKGVMWVVSIVPAMIVALRIYVRVTMKRTFGWDDGVILVATACLLAYAAVCHVAANAGLGLHTAVVAMDNPDKLIDVSLLCHIGEVLAIMACTLGKTSFAITLMRIFVQRWLKVVLWFVIITMNIVNVLAAVFVFAQCKDPRNLWDKSIPSECWPIDVFTHFSLFVGAYSGAQDFVLALLPWIIIWGLQMKKKEKFGIALAMSMGIFAGASSIVKTIHLVALSETTDFAWELAPLLYWAGIEDGLAIFAASIPALRPLIRRFSGYSDPNVSTHPKIRLQRNYPLKSLSNNVSNMFPHPQGESHTTVYENTDDQSDKSILDQKEHNWQNSQNIKQTTAVDITYDQR
ncbi:hypothetical protein FQN54_006127 [Arachnomyces sp. PD_36]|nr:hypothetical protein FQN54_006127 [Arachnomyces sp. PD_36]